MRFPTYQSPLLLTMEEYYPLKKKEAEAAFQHFLSQVPICLDCLIKQCSSDELIEPQCLDFSPESLITVWRWFLKRAKVRRHTKAEHEHMEQLFGYLGPTVVGAYVLTEETKHILQDIGLYLASVFMKQYPHMRWDYVRRPKSNVFFQNPIIAGFLDTRYGTHFEPEFPPIHMVSVQATKLITEAEEADSDFKALVQRSVKMILKPEKKGKEKAEVNDLFDLYKLWEPRAIEGRDAGI